ncbi:TolC family protein [Plectonema cf. radiosum LEGE 06105]|uniref:TolC family protein n=2 Tax=Plectonema TaxID=1183 RepID=A0A8J7JZN9_9CYAN|nr:TolC family protein [Plectonema cf. radiosum LEGE 06105]
MANSIDFSQIHTIPNYSIPSSEETTVRFQLSVPSEPIPPDDSKKPSLKQKEINNNQVEVLSNPTGNSSTQNTPKKVTPNNSIRSKSVLDSLNPNANPLQYPTKPEEVQIQKIQAITLEQALELARRNNRELQVGLLELERLLAAVKEAQASLLPSAGLSAEFGRQQSAQNQLAIERTNFGNDEANTAFNGSLQLNYDLYTGGRRNAQIGQAEERLRVQELAVEVLEEEVRLNVSTEYLDLQQSDEEVRIAQAAVVNARASLRDAQALERAGVGTKFDVLRTQVNLANAQQQLTNTIASQQVARRSLVARLSLSQSVDIAAADPVKLAGLWKLSLENSIVLAYQNRSELQQQLAQRNINLLDRRLALSVRKPQITLVASYNLLDQFDDSVSVTDGYSVAVRSNFSLYDGGRAKAQAAQAKANVKIAETQFANTRNQIRFQVEQAFSGLQSNLENVQTSNVALEQARESLRLARLRFQAGVGTQLEVIDAENALTTSEGNRIRAILDYNRALANLQRSVTSRALVK